jgi:hypothetical protein
MSKYVPIQNIGALVLRVVYFTLIGFYARSVYHVILPFTKYTKVGSCNTGRTWARQKFQ